MRPWAKNELILMGPTSDPAHVRGMRDGAAALKKIAETKSPFVDFYGPGSRNIAHALWTKAGIEPRGDWLLKDESVAPQSVVSFAAERHAYVIVGRIPILQGKIPSAGMEIMVQGDEAMRRPYVVMEAKPRPEISSRLRRPPARWRPPLLRDRRLRAVTGLSSRRGKIVSYVQENSN
jgi:tungstate transport system substrate-binding protein